MGEDNGRTIDKHMTGDGKKRKQRSRGISLTLP